MRARWFFGSVFSLVSTSLVLATTAAAAPSLDVAAPLDETVGRPTIHIDASCDAGGGAPCTTVTLVEQLRGGEVHTQLMRWYGVTHVDFDVAIDDGAFADLELHATDAAGNATVIDRRVYGDTSAALHELATVDGTIYDADATRVLYEANGETWILDRAACTRTDVGAGSAQALTPRGALVAACSGGCTLSELRDGAMIARGAFDPSSLRTAGTYAVWTEGYGPSPLHRLDLATGDDRVIAPDATPGSGAVGPDGAVTYSRADGTAHVAHRWSAGTDVALGPGDLSATDGALSVFTDDDSPACATRLYANGAAEDLSPLCTSPAYLATVRAGWVAYVTPDASGARQLWTRSPSGARTQLTTTGCDLAPSLADDGAALARTSDSADSQTLTLFPPGAAPRAITHSDPFVVRNADNHWLIAIGRTLFTIDGDTNAIAASACPTPAPLTTPTPAPAPTSAEAPAAGCSASGGGGSWLFALALALSAGGARSAARRARRSRT